MSKPILFDTIKKAKFDTLTPTQLKKNYIVKKPDGTVLTHIGTLDVEGGGGSDSVFIASGSLNEGSLTVTTRVSEIIEAASNDKICYLFVDSGDNNNILLPLSFVLSNGTVQFGGIVYGESPQFVSTFGTMGEEQDSWVFSEPIDIEPVVPEPETIIVEGVVDLSQNTVTISNASDLVTNFSNGKRILVTIDTGDSITKTPVKWINITDDVPVCCIDMPSQTGSKELVAAKTLSDTFVFNFS